MGLRNDYQRIGDLILLCAQTMRMLSAEKHARGCECPFEPSEIQLEELSRKVKEIAADLPADCDPDPGRSVN